MNYATYGRYEHLKCRRSAKAKVPYLGQIMAYDASFKEAIVSAC